ncbi:MAG TPA: hypothetical protein VJ302_29630 [Blastocatellia bacterium]|nr:hypothetical protein [Blastocatellia bacterium]
MRSRGPGLGLLGDLRTSRNLSPLLVHFVFKLDHLVGRLALAVAAALVCGALSWLTYAHFVIRGVADPRLSLSREALALTAQKFPDSPRVYLRLARAELANAGGQEPMLDQALAHAKLAADLSGWDYRIRYLLGTLEELGGDSERAEESLRAAARLAPHHAEVNWALANLLIRRGKPGDSLDSFREATRNSDDLRPLAFELLWQSSDGDLELLKRLAGADPAARLSLVQFLLDQKLSSEALGIFHRIDRESKLNSPKSAAFIRSLIDAGQYESARALWVDLAAVPTDAGSPPGGLLWNGGFESEAVRELDHFDWILARSEYARITTETGMAHSGTRSLKIAFAGRDTTNLNGEIKQLVALRPGRRYRLEGYARAGDLVTTEGPRLALLGPNGVIATSEPVVAGASDWQRLVIDFVGPDDSSEQPAAKFIGIVRIPKFSYDDPTRGVVWFDDLSLTERDSAGK